MSENTRTCCLNNGTLVSTFTLLQTPAIAANASQLISQTQQQNQWVYVSTVQAAIPNYKYQYKDQTERINAKIGRLSLNNC